jgi:hypothetical protein
LKEEPTAYVMPRIKDLSLPYVPSDVIECDDCEEACWADRRNIGEAREAGWMFLCAQCAYARIQAENERQVQ